MTAARHHAGVNPEESCRSQSVPPFKHLLEIWCPNRELRVVPSSSPYERLNQQGSSRCRDLESPCTEPEAMPLPCSYSPIRPLFLFLPAFFNVGLANFSRLTSSITSNRTEDSACLLIGWNLNDALLRCQEQRVRVKLTLIGRDSEQSQWEAWLL